MLSLKSPRLKVAVERCLIFLMLGFIAWVIIPRESLDAQQITGGGGSGSGGGSGATGYFSATGASGATGITLAHNLNFQDVFTDCWDSTTSTHILFGSTAPPGATGAAGTVGHVSAATVNSETILFSDPATGLSRATTGPFTCYAAIPGGGAVGPSGAVGATGPTGAAGTNGTNGSIGPTGAQGAQGVPGVTGPTGPTGPANGLAG